MDFVVPTIEDEPDRLPLDAAQFGYDPDAADAAADLGADLGAQFLEGALEGEDKTERATGDHESHPGEPLLFDEEGRAIHEEAVEEDEAVLEDLPPMPSTPPYGARRRRAR